GDVPLDPADRAAHLPPVRRAGAGQRDTGGEPGPLQRLPRRRPRVGAAGTGALRGVHQAVLPDLRGAGRGLRRRDRLAPHPGRADPSGRAGVDPPLERPMRLELESGRRLNDVSEQDIRTLVEGVDFAILSSDDDTYIQCARTDTQDYVLEHQEGALDQHYRATSAPIRVDDVVSALVKYLRGDASWKTDFTWEKV